MAKFEKRVPDMEQPSEKTAAINMLDIKIFKLYINTLDMLITRFVDIRLNMMLNSTVKLQVMINAHVIMADTNVKNIFLTYHGTNRK